MNLRQGSVLHSSLLERAPVQSAPPLAGTGEVHERVDVFVPRPQVLVHLLHSLHSVRPPSTAVEKIKQ